MSRYTTAAEHTAALAQSIDSDLDPLRIIDVAREIARMADNIEDLAVGDARERGHTWQQIADAAGVKKQAMHHKYGRPPAGQVENGPSLPI